MGSPLNIVFPDIMAQNIETLQTVLHDHRVVSDLYYACKANQSLSLVKQARHAGIKIDVASLRELQTALTCGFHPGKIEVTGPKGIDLLELALLQGVTINVDSLPELEHMTTLLARHPPTSRQPILLRLSGFGEHLASSRFGIAEEDAERAFAFIRDHATNLSLLGLAFHLDTNQVEEKISAIERCLPLFERAHQFGLHPTVLNIGGGLRQVFIEDTERWDAYVTALKNGLLPGQLSLSLPGVTFGFRLEQGRILGVPVFHKYANTIPAWESLAALLSTPLPGHENRTVSQALQENMIRLSLELGKSLVDQTGITITTVQSVRTNAEHQIILNLDIKRDDLVPMDQEVMIDPVVIAQRPAQGEHHEGILVYFGGNLCLERDMIYHHATYLDEMPQTGDLVVFVNTAAYQMDLSASEALMQPKIRKVAVVRSGERFDWFLDDVYAPERIAYAL